MSNQFPNKPKGIKVKHFKDHITITVNSYDYDGVFLYISIIVFGFIIVFGLFWSLFFLLCLFVALIDGQIIGFLTSLVFTLFGILILRSGLVFFINKIYINADNKVIRVRQRPIPAPCDNNIDIRLKKTQELYTREELFRTDSNENDITLLGRSNNTYYMSRYRLCIKKINSDKEITIIETDNQEVPLFIEKTLKDYLNIKHDLQESEVD
jgi:hypothetical protein